MTTDDKINEEKMQDDINREAVKILSSGKITIYYHYHLEKLINMDILQMKKQCLLIKGK